MIYRMSLLKGPDRRPRRELRGRALPGRRAVSSEVHK